MESWKGYILDILVVSISISIFLQILPDSGKKELLHLLSGILLTVVILMPLSDIRLNDFLDLTQYLPESSDYLLERGAKTAEEAKRQYITGRCEAYILDKAKALGAEILPIVQVDETFLPVYAEIRGDPEPQVQKQLEQMLVLDMGITKENQRWIGNPEKEN